MIEDLMMKDVIMRKRMDEMVESCPETSYNKHSDPRTSFQPFCQKPTTLASNECLVTRVGKSSVRPNC